MGASALAFLACFPCWPSSSFAAFRVRETDDIDTTAIQVGLEVVEMKEGKEARGQEKIKTACMKACTFHAGLPRGFSGTGGD